MVGQYFNVLPTGIAGDAVRGYRVRECLPNASTSYVILLVERVAGLIGLLGIAGITALYSPALRGGSTAVAMNIGTAIALAIGGVSFVLPQIAERAPSIHETVAKIPIVGGMLASLPVARGARGPITAVILSFVTQALVVLSIAALIQPLAPSATLSVCARVVPAIVLLTYIPLTPGAIGQREALFVHFFSLVHVEREAALAASILSFAVMLSLAFAGGLVLLYERARGLSR
jgi:uncharacterized membrane protein YbhN (UPF0104 family)